MFTGRMSGKTTKCIEEAARAQDEGADLVVIVVPKSDMIHSMYDMMAENLDMGRVMCVLSSDATRYPELRKPRRLIQKKKGWFKRVYVREPAFVIVDNADMIPPMEYARLIDWCSGNVRLVTANTIPGLWAHDLPTG